MTHAELERLNYRILPCEESDLEYIEEQFRVNEDTVAPPRPDAESAKIVLKIVDETGSVLAGSVTWTSNWDVAEFGILWVDERFRKHGYGSALLWETERQAKALGCYLITLDTCDFQAKPFYEKHGYTLCGTSENVPRGHCDHIMMKRLDVPVGSSLLSEVDSAAIPAILSGTEEDAKFLGRMLGDYNLAQAPESYDDTYVSLGKKITDERGTLIAACDAYIGGLHSLGVCLWVEEPYRNQGIGSCLLRWIESEAKKLGAYIAEIEIGDWQLNFFQKNGYIICATIEDFPRGHCRYIMTKEL